MGQVEINDGYKGFIGLVSAVVFVFMIRYYKEVLNFGNVLEKNLWGYLTLVIVWLVVLIIGFIILYFTIKIIGRLLIFTFQSIYYKIAHWNDEARFIQSETIEIENLLSKVFVIDDQSLTNDIERLRNKMSICRYYKELTHFIPQFKKRLAKARELLEELEKNKMADELEKRNLQLREENEVLEKLNKEKIIQQENEKEAILYRFNSKDENVFFKEDLTEEEVQALVEKGYYSVSEYCIINKKFINVLVKPCLKHSPTHIFLVWNAKRLLKKIRGVENIREHLSVDADLTFEYNKKTFALEIETGTLLGKTKQIKEKLAYLNKKYPNRWMFIVSNKNLLSKYRKLGPATQRSEVAETLQKLLENTHPVLRGGK